MDGIAVPGAGQRLKGRGWSPGSRRPATFPTFPSAITAELRDARRRLTPSSTRFSSGVMLAMNSGSSPPRRHRYLSAPAFARRRRARFDRLMRHGPKEFSWFIYRVTNPIDARFLHGARRTSSGSGALLLSVLARRHLRQDADLALDPDIQSALLRRQRHPAKARIPRLEAAALQYPPGRRCRPSSGA